MNIISYTRTINSRCFEIPRSLLRGCSFEAGIPTAVHYPIPLHLQPVFANSGFKEGDFPISEAAAKRVMSLPMGPDLKEAEQQSITATLCAASSETEQHAVNT